MSDVDDWMDVAAAALVLEVSPRHVRGLIERGVLPAERVGGNWVVLAAAARSRAAHAPGAGRPLSPELAWHLLAVAQFSFDHHGRDEPASLHELDRRKRHRLRELLAVPTSAAVWGRRVADRAERRRYWAHPGALPLLAADPRLRIGGAAAAAAAGVGIAATAPERFYIDADDVAPALMKYRLKPDPAGQVQLMVVPGGMPRDLLDGTGPVPAAVALADLLDSDDARERHEAATYLEPVSLQPAP